MKIAIIGTREIETPKEVLTNIIQYLKDKKILVTEVRSGNAEGTDQLANKFLKDKNIKVAHYLPWKSYNYSLRVNENNVYYIHKETDKFDDEIIEMFPYMEKMKSSVWALVRRNYQIILGTNGDDPVDLVFWHTIAGKLKGGTRYGVMLARGKKITDVSV